MKKLVSLIVAASIATVLAACSGEVDSEPAPTPNPAVVSDPRPLSAATPADVDKLCKEDLATFTVDLNKLLCLTIASFEPPASCQKSYDDCLKAAPPATCSKPDLSNCPQMPTIGEFRTCAKAMSKAAHEAVATYSCANPPKTSESAEPKAGEPLPECKKIQEGCPSVLGGPAPDAK